MNKIEIENRIKAMEEELNKLKEQLNKEEKGYFKPRANKEYYCVNFASVIKYDWCDMNFDNICYNTANCFETKEEAEKVLFEQTLFRKIKRFRDTYDKGVDWNNYNERKYYIHYDCENKEIIVDWIYEYKDILVVCFKSQEVAERCLKEFREDLEKYLTGNY